VPKLSGKITPAEREICARLKFFRETIIWSQNDFAAQLGLTYNQLASIEYERTPLRYEIAWKTRSVFGLSLSWLLAGRYPPNEPDLDPWPNPETLERRRPLLSEVGKALRFSDPNNPAVKEREKIWFENYRNKAPLGPSRSALLAVINHKLAQWMDRLPGAKVNDFANQLFRFAENYLSRFPGTSDIKVSVRSRALIWGEMRADINKRLARENTSEVMLDKQAGTVHGGGVKTKIRSLPDLLKAIREHTKLRGQKAALARAVGVSRQALDQFLHGEAKPSAEITFKLLKQVEQSER